MYVHILEWLLCGCVICLLSASQHHRWIFQLLLETQGDVHILLKWLLCYCVMCLLSVNQPQ